MAISTNSLNATNFDSFFQEMILDNNGIAVTDINAGLVNLFKTFNEEADNFSEVERYLVGEFEEGYPDLVAKNSNLANTKYWWWICLLNRLENPMTDIKANWVYAINSPATINSFINKSNQIMSTSNRRIGTIVELN